MLCGEGCITLTNKWQKKKFWTILWCKNIQVCKVLVHVSFATSQTELDIWYKKLYIQVVSQVAKRLKIFVHNIFASLFCMSKKEHLWNEKKCDLFHFESSFRSWNNQILTFQIFKCHDVINCLSMKHEKRFTE